MNTHPSFSDKPNDNAILWRYLSLERFIDLLISNELHFARLDQFSDHFEGAWPKKDILSVEAQFGKDKAKPFIESIRDAKKFIAVSCWHENQDENAAMWQVYNASKDGIAILTTFGKLKAEFFSNAKNDTDLTYFDMARVKYLDHFSNSLLDVGAKEPNLFHAPMCKNIGYTHEREVRALVASKFFGHEFSKSGHKIRVDLNTIIDRIVINPYAPNRIFTTIQDLLHKYGLKKELSRSTMCKSIFEENYS